MSHLISLLLKLSSASHTILHLIRQCYISPLRIGFHLVDKSVQKKTEKISLLHYRELNYMYLIKRIKQVIFLFCVMNILQYYTHVLRLLFN